MLSPVAGVLPAAPPRPLFASTVLKRLFDVVTASLALLVALPFLVLLLMAVFIDSAGNPFFVQERLGLHGTRFKLLKLRTMVPDAERRRAEIEHLNEALPPLFKVRNDPRVTRVGRILRATSLDELPQLINVLRGEMSLVGPRPCIPYETESFQPHHFDRFLVPAGLTGLWQTSARAQSTFGEALDMDVLYAQSWSLSLDLLLLARTPLQLLRPAATA